MPARYAADVSTTSRASLRYPRTSVAKLAFGRLDDSQTKRCGHRFGARMDFEFLENGGNMMIYGLRREVQAACELGIGVTTHQQSQYVDLAPCKSSRIAARRSAWPARNAPHTPVAQPLTHDCSQRASTELFEDHKCLTERRFGSVSTRERLLVRHAESLPGISRRLPFAFDHQAIGFDQLMVDPRLGTGSRVPIRELAADGWIAMTLGNFEPHRYFTFDCFEVSAIPGRLCARGGHAADALQFGSR